MIGCVSNKGQTCARNVIILGAVASPWSQWYTHTIASVQVYHIIICIIVVPLSLLSHIVVQVTSTKTTFHHLLLQNLFVTNCKNNHNWSDV